MFNRKQLEADSRLNRLHNPLSTSFSQFSKRNVSHHASSNQCHRLGSSSMDEVCVNGAEGQNWIFRRGWR